MAAIYYKDDAGNEVKFDFPPGASEVTIGRGAGNDLRIRKPSISRKHARFSIESGGCTLMDLGSSNGSFVNGERLAAQVPRGLQNGDDLKCGEIEMRFERVQPTAETDPVSPATASPAPVPAADRPQPSIPKVAMQPPEPLAFTPPPPPPIPMPPKTGGDPMAAVDPPPPTEVLGDDDVIDQTLARESDAADVVEARGAADEMNEAAAGEEPSLGFEATMASEGLAGAHDEYDPDALLSPAEPEASVEPPPPAEPEPEPDLGPEAAPIPEPSQPEPVEEEGPYLQEEKSAIVMALDDAALDLFGETDSSDDEPAVFEPDPIPDLPDDPARRAEILLECAERFRSDLSDKSRRLISLQRAARRDVDTKKRLAKEKEEADGSAEAARSELERVASERDTLREDVDRLNGLLEAGEAGVSEIEAQLQETRSELDNARSDREELGRKVESLTGELEARPTTEAVEGLEETLGGLREDLLTCAAERDRFEVRADQADRLEARVTELEADNERLMKSLQEAPTPERYKEMELDLRALRREASSGAGRSGVLEKQLKDKEKALDGFKAKARATFNELATTLRSLEADKMAVDKQFAEASGRIEELDGQAQTAGADAEQRIHDLREQVDSLSGGRGELASELDDVKAKAGAAEQRSNTLEQELEALRAQAEGSVDATELQKLKDQLSVVESDIAGTQSELDEARERILEKDGQISELQSVTEAAEEGLGSEVARLKEAEAALNDETTTLKEDVGRLTDLLATAERERDTVLGEVETAQESMAEMDAQVSVLKQAGEAATTGVEAGRAEAEALRDQLEESTSDLADARRSIDEMEVTVEALRLAAADAPPKDKGDEAASPAGAGGGVDTTQVSDMVDRINDVVSNWKNNFMHLGNFLLDVRNGVELLKDGGGDPVQALEEMESSGTAEEMQELLQRCEDDSRALKKELRGFREDLLD